MDEDAGQLGGQLSRLGQVLNPDSQSAAGEATPLKQRVAAGRMRREGSEALDSNTLWKYSQP